MSRAVLAGPVPTEFVEKTRASLLCLHERAVAATTREELALLEENAESYAQHRAYLCPLLEIETAGYLAIDLIAEWGVPTSIVTNLREKRLGPKLADKDPAVARGALRDVFEEFDSWSQFEEEHEDLMRLHTRILTALVVGCVLVAPVAFRTPWAVPFGIFLAGVAGGCVSVLSRPRPLTVSSELAVYRRQIYARICTGLAASLIGCALLAWGVLAISFQNQTFGDVLAACGSGESCTAANIVILTGVPMLLGFSEQALTSFEGLFAGSARDRRRRPSR